MQALFRYIIFSGIAINNNTINSLRRWRYLALWLTVITVKPLLFDLAAPYAGQGSYVHLNDFMSDVNCMS